MKSRQFNPPSSIGRRLLAAAALAACVAPAMAGDSAMLLQYELAHGRGRAEHTLGLAWAASDAPPGESSTASPMRLPLFTTARDRWALLNAEQTGSDSGGSGFARAVLAVVVVGTTVAVVAAGLKQTTDDLADDIYESRPLTPLPPAPPAGGGG